MCSLSVCCVSMYGGLINNGLQLGVRSLPVSVSVTAVSGKPLSVIIISGFGIYGAAVVPDSGVGKSLAY